ncbi:response regulator [Deinococcus sonorensis]
MTFDDAGLSQGLQVVHDGVEALSYLRHETPYRSCPDPALVLLSLHLPRLDGLEVLTQLEQDGTLRRIPVLVLLSSWSDQDHLTPLPASCGYLLKPIDAGELAAAWQQLKP